LRQGSSLCGDRTQVRQFATERSVVLLRRRHPDSVVAVLPVGLVAQEKHNFLLDVDRRAAKHLSRPRPNVGKLIEHEFKRDLVLFRGGEEVVGTRAHRQDARRRKRPRFGIVLLSPYKRCAHQELPSALVCDLAGIDIAE
jgi:hypothetical protein